MRLLRTIFLSLTAAALPITASAQDSLVVHSSVRDYYDSIVFEPVDSIIAKVDSLVAALEPSGKDIQAAAAGLAFDYFNTSPIMGVEGVSVHVARDYFLSGLLPWKDSLSYFMLAPFVEFNELSLLGLPAQELEMESIDGEKVSLRQDSGERKIVYFYEPGCSSCARVTPALVALLSGYEGAKTTLFAINTADDRAAWQAYAAANFAQIQSPDVKVVNLWDPEVETGYHKKYGVMKTPALLLLDSQNTIRGRKLSVQALSQLLGIFNKDRKDYNELYDNIFSYIGEASPEAVAQVVDQLASRAEGDSTVFREVIYNLLGYLRTSTDYALQQGAVYTAERYILGEPWYWSDEYMDRIYEMLQKDKLNPPGSRASNLLLQDTKGRYATLFGECGPFYTLVVFHLVKCSECEKTIEGLEAMRRKLNSAGVRVVMIYTGHDEKLWQDFAASHPKNWKYLMDKTLESHMHELYDLQYVPHIYLLDENRTVVAKDISLSTLTTLLPVL